MAYDRYDARRDGRDERPRWRDNDHSERSSSGRDREERGWFERAGEEIAGWFGSDDDRDRSQRSSRPDRFAAREDDRSGRGRDPNRERAFMGDEDFGRFERSPRWRDEGYRRPYTGRSAGRQDFGPERGREPYRPLAGDYGRGSEEALERGGSFYGVGAPHDRHYGEWRARQLDELDRDYEDYARENRSRFEDDFSSWREKRQSKRQLLRGVREQMEVVGSDGEAVGTVERTAGDRLILAKSGAEGGGGQHSLTCTALDRVEGDKVFLGMTADEARKQWRDDNRERALFERDDQGEAGPHVLNRSFSGTY
jgi:hypothetical protein